MTTAVIQKKEKKTVTNRVNSALHVSSRMHTGHVQKDVHD